MDVILEPFRNARAIHVPVHEPFGEIVAGFQRPVAIGAQVVVKRDEHGKPEALDDVDRFFEGSGHDPFTIRLRPNVIEKQPVAHVVDITPV